ncbi:MAG: hypothetical protein M1827_005769 [Pycnora praestabilis]|nr:MAG: hypothetical protein M1827_005769 [Pycnora praestabilis]
MYSSQPTSFAADSNSNPTHQHATTPQLQSQSQYPQEAQQQLYSQPQISPNPTHTNSDLTINASSPETSPRVNGSSGGPNFPQFSASTTEILKRMNATNGGGTPDWEAAREQVLKRMVTTQNMPVASPPTSGTGTGRRGGRGAAKVGSPAVGGTIRVDNGIEPHLTGRGRGRGRGGTRGRASGGRGGKRKRVKVESEESDQDSDTSLIQNFLPTATKSGRLIHRPTHFSPAVPPSSQSSPSNRHRRAYRRAHETTVCKVCARGHSPMSNMIVLCDGCDRGWHMHCHDPPIAKEVVAETEKEWFCRDCRAVEAGVGVFDLGERISGEGLSADEQKFYLLTLPHAHLVSLLLHATTLQPTLPLFPSTTKSHLANSTTPSSNSHGSPFRAITTINKTQRTPLPQTDTTSTLKNDGNNGSNEEDMSSSNDVIDSDDQQAAYPKPGNGIRLPPEDEDLEWLVDDDYVVFSHTFRGGEGGGAAAVRAGAGGTMGNGRMAEGKNNGDGEGAGTTGVSEAGEGRDDGADAMVVDAGGPDEEEEEERREGRGIVSVGA